ncbi:MAG: RluA family pseudouridine synthase [Acidimicrobiales bacterium]
MNVLSVVVPASLDGVRVDKAVALVADMTRSSVSALIDAGRVRVDGRTVRSRSAVLRAGQQLEVDRDEVRAADAPQPDPTVVFEVVHQDRDIVVVDKPAGLVVHPGAGHRSGTLVNGLLARYPELGTLAAAVGSDPDRPGVVHRLDRGTSGLLVVARTPDAYRSLVAQLAARRVTRIYQALVLGTVEGESGLVDAPVGRSATSPTRMAVSRKGKEARTRYRVERRFTHPGASTLVAASLETGRTHQIRVHLSAIGHPVVGDEVYGWGRSLPGVTTARPFLHAGSLAFRHPLTGEEVAWTSELPAALEHLLDQLG